MRKHKNKITAGIIIAIVLAFAFWYGGDSASLRGWTAENEEKEMFAETAEATPPETADKLQKPATKTEDKNAEKSKPIIEKQTEEVSASANPVTKEAAPKTNTPAEKEEAKQTVSNVSEDSAAASSNYGSLSDAEKNSLSEESFSNQVTNEKESAKEQTLNTDEPADTEKHQTASVSEENPLPIEPEETFFSDKELTCTLSVRCDTILKNITWLDEEKINLIPVDGVIFAEKTVSFYEGESVFNLLAREMKKNKIHLEFENTPVYNSAYIEGIANLYEFDCGELSGWMYKVNDWFPNYGCSRYQLKSGDKVEWIYTCDLGADVGGDHTQRINNYE